MSTIRTLLRSLREYRRPSLLTPFFVTGEVILECFLPLVMASLVDHLQGGALTPVVRLGIFMLVMAMFSLLFGILAARFGATAAAGLAKHLRQDLFFKVQDFSFGDVDRFSTSSLVTRMTTDVTNVQNAYGMIIRVAVRVPLMVVFSIIMTLRINWHMSLIFLIILPFLAAIMFGIIIFIFPVFRRIFKKYDALNNSVQENIAGIRVVKSFVNEEYEKTRFAKRSEEVRADFTFAEKVLALNTPVMMLFIFGAIMLVDFIGAQMIVASGGTELTTGQLSALITYGIQILHLRHDHDRRRIRESYRGGSSLRIAADLSRVRYPRGPHRGYHLRKRHLQVPGRLGAPRSIGNLLDHSRRLNTGYCGRNRFCKDLAHPVDPSPV